MNRFSNLMLCAALAGCAAAAQAGTTLKAADLPRISNGSTGFIGVTESAGMPRQPVAVRWSASGTTEIPLRAGEATTFVNGRPNEEPHAAGLAGEGARMAGAPMGRALGTMGASRAGAAMSDFPPGAHPGWGTPD